MIDLNRLGEGLRERSYLSLVEEGFRKVVANIRDDRTDSQAKRKVKIEIVMAPDEERRTAEITYTVQAVLAPVSGYDLFDVDRNRQLLQADGYIPGQQDFRDVAKETGGKDEL